MPITAVPAAVATGCARWCREPYRALFPLGVLLVWAGVLPWLLFAVGALPEYRNVFHPTVQIQGFLTCFAAGFLMTMIPRRTGTATASPAELGLVMALPVGTTVASWLRLEAIAQACWLGAVALLLRFALRRLAARAAGRRPPVSFVWVPIALGMGAFGAVAALCEAAGASIAPWYSGLGRALRLQGMVLGLVLGVGGMVLPLVTCGDAPPDAGRGSARAVLAHLAAAAALLGTFALEAAGQTAIAWAARALLVAVVLSASARLYRLPRRPGWHRWLVWLSGWLIPLGYATAAAAPNLAQAGLHVVFVGGFGLMALAVGAHVILAHGERDDLVFGRPWQVPALGALLLVSVVLRALVLLDPPRTLLWMGASAAAFLAATLAWAGLTIPVLRRPPA
jgi:uncharacterized protein involved in response to NO